MIRHILSCAALLACFTLAGLIGPIEASAPPKADDDTQKLVYLSARGPVLLELHLRIDGRSFRSAWSDFMAALFDYLDKDGDGVLNKEEAAQAPPAAVLASSAGFFGGRAGPSAIAGTDGKATRAMLAEHYRKAGLPPFQISLSRPNNGVWEIDGDTGTLRGSRGSSDALNARLFKLLDTDGDGKLSRAELAAAPKVLGKLDADEDEMITAAELQGRGGETSSGDGATFAFTTSMKPTTATNGDFHVVADGPVDMALGQRLLARYAKKGSKTVTAGALGLDRQAMARLDRNGDGMLDAGELAAFAQGPADLAFMVRLGKRDARQKVVEQLRTSRPAPAGIQVKQSGDGVLLEMGNVRLELRGPEASSNSFVFDIRQQYISQFKAADLDNNGYLDKEEAKKSPLFNGLFAAMDRDGDGKLFEKEMLAYLDQMDRLRKRAGSSCLSLIVTDSGKGLFEMVDLDRDGRLSVRELRQMVKLLDKLDADGDGKLSPVEVPRHYRGGFELGAAGAGGGQGNVIVVRKFGGAAAPAPPAPMRGPLWFRKMDRNRDGDVSRKEWLGTEEEFRAIDSDGDGLISLAEAEAFDQRVRLKKK
jgi:Ca2+-binding EF-hand superfamily protein